MGKHLTMHATIQVAPASSAALFEALRPAWKACSLEPELLFFDVFQDVDTPGKFRFVEVWSKDKEWFMAHQLTKPYYKPYMEATQPLWIKDPILEFTEREPGWSIYKDGYFAEGEKIS